MGIDPNKPQAGRVDMIQVPLFANLPSGVPAFTHAWVETSDGTNDAGEYVRIIDTPLGAAHWQFIGNGSVTPAAGAQVFSASGSFTVPAGITKMFVFGRPGAVGGSGGCGGAAGFGGGATGGGGAGGCGGAGGGGAQLIGPYPIDVTPGQVLTVIVGAGGAGGAGGLPGAGGVGVGGVGGFGGQGGTGSGSSVSGTGVSIIFRGSNMAPASSDSASNAQPGSALAGGAAVATVGAITPSVGYGQLGSPGTPRTAANRGVAGAGGAPGAAGQNSFTYGVNSAIAFLYTGAIASGPGSSAGGASAAGRGGGGAGSGGAPGCPGDGGYPSPTTPTVANGPLGAVGGAGQAVGAGGDGLDGSVGVNGSNGGGGSGGAGGGGGGSGSITGGSGGRGGQGGRGSDGLIILTWS